MINAAIVGLGWWGGNIASALHGSDKIRVVRGIDADADTAQAFAADHDVPARHMAFAGGHVATADDEGGIAIIEPEDGRMVTSIGDLCDAINALALSADGARIAAASHGL